MQLFQYLLFNLLQDEAHSGKKLVLKPIFLKENPLQELENSLKLCWRLLEAGVVTCRDFKHPEVVTTDEVDF